MAKNKFYKIAEAFSSVTQAGVSMLTPVILFVLLGKFLINKFSLSKNLMVIFIIVGVISGFYSMFKYMHAITKDKENK